MKIYKLLFVLVAIIILSACSGESNKKEINQEKSSETIPEEGIEYNINHEESMVNWRGMKPTGSHDGTLRIIEGKFRFKNDLIVSGDIMFDMNTIECTDLEDPDENQKLVGHLKSEDFFNVDEYPSAKFVIANSVKGDYFEDPETKEMLPSYVLNGHLTIKGITDEISFTCLFQEYDETMKIKSGFFKIDRTKWNIRYGSKKFFDNLIDNFIYDEMAIKFEIFAVR